MSSVDTLTITPATLISITQQCLDRWPNAQLIKASFPDDSGYTGNLCILDGGIDGEYVGMLDLRFGELNVWGEDADASS